MIRVIYWHNVSPCALHFRRQSGASIGQLAKEFRLGEATIYRVLKTFKFGDN
ncbi:TPA: helix-turn-helix domain-containing protein [Salmonella enterica subsp. diarizonae]|nr:helix-turn-helix domain-containing protein [Salmonella enterica subsp. diarizonae]